MGSCILLDMEEHYWVSALCMAVYKIFSPLILENVMFSFYLDSNRFVFRYYEMTIISTRNRSKMLQCQPVLNTVKSLISVGVIFSLS